MRQLFLALAALILVIGVLQFIPVQVGSQAQGESPHPQASEVELALTTSWGEPNLQGLWTAEYQTPLQRPPEYADREFLTEEEIAELDEFALKKTRIETTVKTIAVLCMICRARTILSTM